jgi:hypothetical protein
VSNSRKLRELKGMDLRSPGEWLLDRVSFSKCNSRVKLHILYEGAAPGSSDRQA